MRVLLASDGSRGALVATGLAESIAWPIEAVLRVITVVGPIVTPRPTTGSAAAPILMLEATDTDHLKQVNNEVVGRIGALGRVVDGVVVRGRPASAIIDEAQDFRADLALVGSRGQGAIASLLLGSASSEVVDRAPCSVLVARVSTLSKVVFATDGSTFARAAEAILAAWSIFSRLPITVVSVADVARPWTTGIAPTMHQEVLKAHEADLREAMAEHGGIAADAAERLRDAGRVVEADIRGGDAAAEIIGAAVERSADLVVLGSRGRTGLTRVLLGSVARNVLSGTSASVLVVRDRTP